MTTILILIACAVAFGFFMKYLIKKTWQCGLEGRQISSDDIIRDAVSSVGKLAKMGK